LPAPLAKEDSWEDFVRSFPNRYAGPDEFRRICRTGGGKERKRHTDEVAKAPFSPYNLWLYKQTYYGIRDVLAPLVRSRQACVLPMQQAQRGKPWIVEICPASTLKCRELYEPYKGSKPGRSEARHRILKAIETTASLSVPDTLRSRIIHDRGGDALDSIVAAAAVFRALPDLTRLGKSYPDYALEGYIYT
jgi:hypothetical protein